MKVIITDCDHENIDIEKNIFDKENVNFELMKLLTEEDLIENCKDAEIMINQYAPMTRKVICSLDKLKLIIRYGVGVNNIDLEAAKEYGVIVCNVPDYGMNEVADHAIALMLNLNRKIHIMDRYTKEKEWNYMKSIPIHRNSNQTVGIIGLGRIGRNFGLKASALGFNVIGYDKYMKENIQGIKNCDFESLITESDFISIHCPLEGSEKLINYEVFKKMKRTSSIINVARGGIIDENDLKIALNEKLIASAALDCMENEPVELDNELFRFENVLVTPHMAWYSEEAAKELKTKVALEAINFIKNGVVSYPVV